MQQKRRIAGTASHEVWEHINADFASGEGMHDYHVLINLNNQEIELDIVSSPGGSAEGGYDTTRLTAHLHGHRGFHFAIHPEDFLYKIGKLFGMEDITTGYTDFDRNVMVKTNDPQKFKSLFADEDVRQVFQNLSGYSFKIIPHDERQGDHLELYIQRSITNAAEFAPIFSAFCQVATSLESQS